MSIFYEESENFLNHIVSDVRTTRKFASEFITEVLFPYYQKIQIYLS